MVSIHSSMVELFCIFAVLSAVHGSSLTTIDGKLVRVVDNCTPGNDTTCPTGKCCVKEGLAYIPEYTGPRPTFELSCKPYRQKGEFCYRAAVTTVLHAVCPCENSLNCTSNGIFGQCE